MYTFGKSSKKKRDTCHLYLIKILNRALSMSPVDFGISEGFRSLKRQNKLFLEGKSKIDGIARKGKHNTSPSRAADIYIYTSNKKYKKDVAYNKAHLSFVAGLMFAACDQLNKEGEINCKLRWGADWNGNGIIDLDQSFDDYPHFEIINIDAT